MDSQDNDPLPGYVPEEDLRVPLDFDPQKIFATMVRLGYEWADLKAAAETLERTEDSVEWEVFRQSAHLVPEKVDRRAYAKGCQRTLDHRKAVIEAKRLAERAKIRWVAYQTAADNIRSEHATQRAELQRLGMTR